MLKHWLMSLVAALAVLGVGPALADSTDARCDIYLKGEDRLEKMIPCRFSQRQGYVNIARDDGIVHDLVPVEGQPSHFRDHSDRMVYRQSGLGDQGLIFRFPDESIFVYWNTAGLEPQDESNPSWPFTTDDYDATALLRCRAAGDSEYGRCPAGILRMEDQQASIVVQNQLGEQFTINFMTDYINATNRALEAHLEGDTWILEFENGETWEVPLAAIMGG